MSGPISDLRERVTLQSPMRAPDDIGGAAIGWVDQGQAWAKVDARGQSAGEAFDGAGSFVSYSVAIRARADVRAGWRLIWRARTLRIQSVSPAPDARLVLSCEEEVL